MQACNHLQLKVTEPSSICFALSVVRRLTSPSSNSAHTWKIVSIKLIFLCFSLIFCENFFQFQFLATFVSYECYRENLVPISPKDPRFVKQTYLCVHR